VCSTVQLVCRYGNRLLDLMGVLERLPGERLAS
jgi:hypothetical protein